MLKAFRKDRFVRVPLIFVLALFFGLWISLVNAAERLEADSFSVVKAKAESLGAKYGPQEVLLVLDVDNTLLAMNQFLGSDQWWGWQSSHLGKKDFAYSVAKDFDGLLEAQGLLFSIGKMHPPEKKVPGIIKDFQSRGFPAIVLTSRGKEFWSSTIRELNANGYDFSESAIQPKAGMAGAYLPYDPNNLKKSCGLPQTAKETYKISDHPRPIIYREGMMMTSGQHKGLMLQCFLHQTNNQFKAALFVDDVKKHTDRVFSVFEHLTMNVTTVRYGHEDGRVKEFETSLALQKKVSEEWTQLQKTIDQIFVTKR